MTTRKEVQRMHRIVEVIRKCGTISKVNLVIASGFSISYYEKLKPFIEELYSDEIQYDKDTRMWCVIEKVKHDA